MNDLQSARNNHASNDRPVPAAHILQAIWRQGEEIRETLAVLQRNLGELARRYADDDNAAGMYDASGSMRCLELAYPALTELAFQANVTAATALRALSPADTISFSAALTFNDIGSTNT